MKINTITHNLHLRLLFSIIFFLGLSLFFSYKKIEIVFLISSIFFLTKFKYQKIIIVNLIIFIFLLKAIIFPFQKKIDQINPEKMSIYEKHFLYGIRNINYTDNFLTGDLSSLDKNYIKKYEKIKKTKAIKIITDELGFRNKLSPKESNFILIGDSFLHSVNISQKNILNYILNNKYNLKTYNASIGATDIFHYFETIKFFKNQSNFQNKKYLMFIFQGNDYLNYKIKTKDNYHKNFNNNFLHKYFKIKNFFNFYQSTKYFLHSLKNKDESFKKVYEYKIKNKDVLFKFDYIFKENYKPSVLGNVFLINKKILPDYIFFIPTKYEVYCDIIQNKICESSKHFSILRENDLLKNVKIIDTTDHFKIHANKILKEKNKLLWEIDDTHLNELGIEELAKIVFSNLSLK